MLQLVVRSCLLGSPDHGSCGAWKLRGETGGDNGSNAQTQLLWPVLHTLFDVQQDHQPVDNTDQLPLVWGVWVRFLGTNLRDYCRLCVGGKQHRSSNNRTKSVSTLYSLHLQVANRDLYAV